MNLEFSNGKELLKIVGLNPRKPKNSVELIDVKSGRKYQAPIEYVQFHLGIKQSTKMTVITKNEYLALSIEDRRLIEDIYSDLSPENLTCDGELSRSAVNQKARILNTKLENLQKRIGYIVPEEIVWDNLLPDDPKRLSFA